LAHLAANVWISDLRCNLPNESFVLIHCWFFHKISQFVSAWFRWALVRTRQILNACGPKATCFWNSRH
jgi:hypothetical protein